ncbi:etfA [Symbiodinium sp. KB8]|nr:etfA [Symbiodinium sp. KB8]
MLARASATATRGLASARFASTLVSRAGCLELGVLVPPSSRDIIAEPGAGVASPGTLSAVTAAKAIGGSVDVFIAGKDAAADAEALAKVDGVARVFKADNEALANGIAEDMTAAVLACQEANKYSHIMTPASNYGKNFLPRVAAKLDMAQVSDVMAIEGEDTFLRPMYAGEPQPTPPGLLCFHAALAPPHAACECAQHGRISNAIARVKATGAVKIMTVRATGFDKASPEGGSAAVEDAPAFESAGKSAFKSEEMVKSDRPELESASVVVSGGRGIKSEENFELMFKLADKLDAAVGASRAAVDAGFCSNDMQVGQTGKIVAPDLYIAVGISGAIQHLAGMKDSKTIVCINKDEEAPIFGVSDYGLVADLFKAVPELTEKLPARS